MTDEDLFLTPGSVYNPKRKEKPGEAICKGQIFRANVSQYCSEYSRGKNAGDVVIGFAVRLRRMKTLSCQGCEKCGWMFDYIGEINDDDFSVEGIDKAEGGKLYQLEGVFSPGGYFDGPYDEFDYFTLTEYKEKK